MTDDLTQLLLAYGDVDAPTDPPWTTSEVLDLLPVGVLIVDALGRTVYRNKVHREAWGAKMDLAVPIQEQLPAYEFRDEDGRPLATNEVPIVRALNGERSDRTIFRQVGVRPMWTRAVATPMLDRSGKVSGAVLVLADVTAEVRHAAGERHRTAIELLLGVLTPRERSVLDLVVAGIGNREIAERLGVSYSTVRTHVRALLRKLGVRSLLELAARVNYPPASSDRSMS